MLTKDKRGIRCDRCGLDIVEKFSYFSFDIQEANVINNTISLKPSTVSFDICPRCLEELKAIIIKSYKPYRIVNNRSCPGGIFCDLSGIHMIGTFTCYYICVSSVTVDIKSKPSTQVMDDKYVELWICANTFAQLKNRAEEIQNKESQEWSSQAIQTK